MKTKHGSQASPPRSRRQDNSAKFYSKCMTADDTGQGSSSTMLGGAGATTDHASGLGSSTGAAHPSA